MIEIYKFGGASVKDADGVVNLLRVIKQRKQEHLGVVVSAMGKTTNALEVILDAYHQNNLNRMKHLVDQFAPFIIN
jgi:Aspartokinases